MKKFFLISLVLACSSIFAGPKEDFIAVYKSACGANDADASSAATPGRSGNVIKWKMCKESSVTVNGCDIPCGSAASKIGG